MKILALEPFYSGSHKSWLDGYARTSQHEVQVLTLPGRNWKWRTQHGAVSLARQYMAQGLRPDLLLGTSLLDFASFLALTRKKTAGIPIAMYFHENQLSYPWSDKERNISTQKAFLGAIQLQSALASDKVFFNSEYNRAEFLEHTQRMLDFFPDDHDAVSVQEIREKSSVLPLGIDLQVFDCSDELSVISKNRPLILWNHRWEYDKNPQAFFTVLRELKQRQLDFGLVVLGECPDVEPDIFIQAREEFAGHIEHWGYVESSEEYTRWLHLADVIPVTSNQDFFGESIAQAIYCGCQPLLPKRLAYPELIPEEFHDDVFYESQQDLVSRLENRLISPGLAQSMKRFDWSRMAPLYDEALQFF